MSTDTSPIPLVPHDVDLRGLPWMRLDTGRLLDSDLFALSTGEEFKAAVALWCKSWTQQPAGSLPKDDRILAELSRAKKWSKVKDMALRGWIECSDGRLYHPVVAEQALLAWEERVAYRAKKDADAERKRLERVEREQMFELLKAAGHTPKWNTPTRDLRDMVDEVTHLSRVTGADESQGQETDIRNLSPAKRGTGRDGTGSLKAFARSPGAGPPDVIVTDGNGNPTTSIIATLTAEQSAVVVMSCKALRKMGSIRFNPGDEGLAALATEGFTAEQIVRTAGEKALRDAGMWNDPDVREDLPDLLINGASQQDMGLTPEQNTTLRGAVSQVSIGYIASALRGKRRDATDKAKHARPQRGAGKPSSADNFEGKNYVGTSVDNLSPELRDRVASHLAN